MVQNSQATPLSLSSIESIIQASGHSVQDPVVRNTPLWRSIWRSRPWNRHKSRLFLQLDIFVSLFHHRIYITGL